MKYVSVTISSGIPKTLYHATYAPLVKLIKAEGLGGKSAKSIWEDSKKGVVYLADSCDVAESYAESNDNVPEDWLDKIVVFKLDTAKLDKGRIHKDANVIDGESTYEYHGIINFNLLTRVTSDE